ncbi:unnamed protein product [Amoebophrya sp. A25]|nr:unnamed protein product [Amoebophrya sp. A25]|eukprot:GSA25T00026974001.1
MAYTRRRSDMMGPEIQQMVYPFSVQKFGENTVMKRTAAIKNHLRTQARDSDRVSTYEHDYSRRVEAGVGWDSARSVSSRTEAEKAESKLPSDQVLSSRKSNPELRNSVSRKKREDYEEGKKHYLQSGGTRTLGVLQRLQEEGRGLNVNPSGWAGTHFTPAKFPSEFRGGTDRQIKLVQSIHNLNLRAPDLYHRIS